MEMQAQKTAATAAVANCSRREEARCILGEKERAHGVSRMTTIGKPLMMLPTKDLRCWSFRTGNTTSARSDQQNGPVVP